MGAFLLIQYGCLLCILKGVKAFFAGTDLHDILNIIDEELAIADLAGVENCLGGIDDGLYRNALTTISIFTLGRRLISISTPR